MCIAEGVKKRVEVQKMVIKIFLVCIVLFVLILLLGVYYNQALEIVFYDIPKEEVPEEFWGTKIILLADLHNHEFGKKNERLLKKIREVNPDYIMIAGDLLLKGEQLQSNRMRDMLSELAKDFPVYYAPGNHEEELERRFFDGYATFKKELQALGVKYLANESVLLERNENRIRVTGLHLKKKYFSKFYEKVELRIEELENLIGQTEAEYEILLAHNPNYLPIYEKWGADLVLSGHVHGGVVILPFFGGVLSTTYEVFPKYDFGMFQSGKTRMKLTKGLAMHTIKFRLFNRPEISLIRLGS